MTENQRIPEVDRRPEAGRPLENPLDAVIETKHSRYPVIGDDLDDVKGILHAKDMLPLPCDGDDPIGGLVGVPFNIKETTVSEDFNACCGVGRRAAR